MMIASDCRRKRFSVFIDGESGTTGLRIRERLDKMDSIIILSIDKNKRKDPTERKRVMRDADFIILCLPDDAARESVLLVDQLGPSAPRIIDASSAHRVENDWVYGFAELSPSQEIAIREADRVSNPGCYPTGAIALLRPLVDANVIPKDYPITINAVSGYSGGGRSAIRSYKEGIAPPFELYALDLDHKHLPELKLYTGLSRDLIFVPSVANFPQGMLLSIPLHLDTLPGAPHSHDIEAVLKERYWQSKNVFVISSGNGKDSGVYSKKIDPVALNGTDVLELYVFSRSDTGHAVLVARLDNLGKGAAGAVVQNLSLMLSRK